MVKSMSDYDKELAFNTILQWLINYHYTISDERKNGSTNEFYAKIHPPNEELKFFEIVSESDFKDAFMLRMSVAFTPKDRNDFEGLREEVQNQFFIRMHKILSPIKLLCKIEDSVIRVEKYIFVEVDSMISKQYFWDNVVEMLNAMYLIELTFHEFIEDIFSNGND